MYLNIIGVQLCVEFSYTCTVCAITVASPNDEAVITITGIPSVSAMDPEGKAISLDELPLSPNRMVSLTAMISYSYSIDVYYEHRKVCQDSF